MDRYLRLIAASEENGSFPPTAARVRIERAGTECRVCWLLPAEMLGNPKWPSRRSHFFRTRTSPPSRALRAIPAPFPRRSDTPRLRSFPTVSSAPFPAFYRFSLYGSVAMSDASCSRRPGPSNMCTPGRTVGGFRGDDRNVPRRTGTSDHKPGRQPPKCAAAARRFAGSWPGRPPLPVRLSACAAAFSSCAAESDGRKCLFLCDCAHVSARFPVRPRINLRAAAHLPRRFPCGGAPGLRAAGRLFRQDDAPKCKWRLTFRRRTRARQTISCNREEQRTSHQLRRLLSGRGVV